MRTRTCSIGAAQCSAVRSEMATPSADPRRGGTTGGRLHQARGSLALHSRSAGSGTNPTRPYVPPTQQSRPGHHTLSSHGELQGGAEHLRSLPRTPNVHARGSVQGMEMVLSNQEKIMATLKKMETQQVALQKAQHSIETAVKEMQQLAKEAEKKTFKVKDSMYEVQLRKEIATLFMTTMTRYPEEGDISAAVGRVISGEYARKHPHIVVCCLKEAATLLSSFRTEERRRVLGCKPMNSMCRLNTQCLAKHIVDYMKGSSEHLNVYIKHLALLRKYVRDEGSTETKQFHQSFKAWVKFKNYAAISDEEWQVISEEDEAHPYGEYPTSNPPLDHHGEQHQDQHVEVQQQQGEEQQETLLHPMYEGFEEPY